MKTLLLFAGLAAALGAARAGVLVTQGGDARAQRDLAFQLQDLAGGGYNLLVTENGESRVLGQLGRRAVEGDGVSLAVSAHLDEAAGAWTVAVAWEGPPDAVFEDCFDFGSLQWYGGPEQKEQYWPIQNSKLNKYSIVAKEEDNSAVSERYWLNSGGEYLYVQLEAPLFVDYHNVLDNHLCLIAEVAAPYSSRRTRNVLEYNVWFLSNAKVAHQHAVDTYLGKPSGIPDYQMIQYPVWSTWVRYYRDIDEEILMDFANQILDSGYGSAQFEIDDLWEICYGSLTVHEGKYKDFAKLVQDIKSLGFRVTIWVHPFINKGCEPWYSDALSKGYLVLNEEGSPDSTWWNDNGTVTSYVDFTNPEAAAWWSGRVRSVLETYDIDSVKFDAGETSWSPQIPVQTGDIELHPGHIVRSFVRLCAEFGPQIEVRTGVRTQDIPVFIRMVDKDSFWSFENGLPTLVTTLLQMNMNGYTLVLPDMIGGNAYDGYPDKELFIRWTQANTFMPAMQYSVVPWDYDDEAVEICRHFTDLHAQFADKIVAAMEASVRDGTPVNAPIWWLDPTDQVALAVWDEYLLGEDVLVAPVMEQGAVARDVYLPAGAWLAGGSGDVIQGPVWLRDYPAPLDVLPYFVKQD